MNRTSWPVLKSAIQQFRYLLLIIFTSATINLLHAEDAHHMAVKCLSINPSVGANSFQIEMKTKSNEVKSDDNRILIVNAYSADGQESTKTIQVTKGKAEFELELKKGPNMLVITDSINTLMVAYENFTAQDSKPIEKNNVGGK